MTQNRRTEFGSGVFWDNNGFGIHGSKYNSLNSEKNGFDKFRPRLVSVSFPSLECSQQRFATDRIFFKRPISGHAPHRHGVLRRSLIVWSGKVYPSPSTCPVFTAFFLPIDPLHCRPPLFPSAPSFHPKSAVEVFGSDDRRNLRTVAVEPSKCLQYANNGRVRDERTVGRRRCCTAMFSTNELRRGEGKSHYWIYIVRFYTD